MADTPIEKIDIDDLTTGAINGTGVFDEIMSTIQIRLDREYDKNRLKGTDYSTVYLGAMQASMQQSIAFLLGKDKAYMESLLIEAQKDKIAADILQTQANILKINAEVRKIDAEILGIQAGVTKINAEVKLINQKASNAIIEGQILGVQLEIARLTKDKTAQEILNMKAAEVSEWAKTKDVVNGVTILGLIGAQKGKISADKALVEQKNKTEQAQISDSVGGTVAGVIGKQKALYAKQADGFDRDAEQKLTKIMTDTWSVRASTNESTDVLGTNLDNPSIGKVVAKAKKGIKV